MLFRFGALRLLLAFWGRFGINSVVFRAWSTSLLKRILALWQQANTQSCLVNVLTASLGALFDSIVHQGAWLASGRGDRGRVRDWETGGRGHVQVHHHLLVIVVSYLN